MQATWLLPISLMPLAVRHKLASSIPEILALVFMSIRPAGAETSLVKHLPLLALAVAYKLGKLEGLCKAIIGSFMVGDHYFQKLAPSAASANPVLDFR